MKARSWAPHILLVATALGMVLVAALKHTSTEEALRIAFDDEASTDERLWAAHVAANRATSRDPRLGDTLVRAFLAAEDERLREGALTIDLSRHAIHPPGARPDAAPPLQSAYVYAAPGMAGTPPTACVHACCSGARSEAPRSEESAAWPCPRRAGSWTAYGARRSPHGRRLTATWSSGPANP